MNASPRSARSAPPRRRSPTPWIIGLVALVVVVAAVVAVVAAGGDDGDDAVSSTTAAAPSAGTGEASASIDALAADVAVTGTALVPLQDPADDPAIGEPAPALVGTNYDGEAVSITPGEDGPLLLVFLAHWCPHCNAEIPVLNEWRKSGAVPDDLRVVGVSTAVAPNRPNYPPGEWLVEKDWQWDVLADTVPTDAETPPAALAAYGVTAFPFFVVVDADGNVTARGSGEKPIEEIEALVTDVAR